MARRLYELPAAARPDLDALLAEDPLSRQSIAVRDTASYDLDRKGILLFLEGDEDVLSSAESDLKALEATVPDEEDELWAAYDDEQESVAGGVGFIFGD